MWRSSNNNNATRIEYILGLVEDFPHFKYVQRCDPTSGQGALFGMGLDSTSAPQLPYADVAGSPATVSTDIDVNSLGYHYVQALEYMLSGTPLMVGGAQYMALQGTIQA